jgi:hypothetical protein
MRSLFIVVSKIYGLIQAYTGLTYIFTVLPLLRMFSQQLGSPDAETSMRTVFNGEQITLSVVSLAAMVVLTFGIAWVLIFRAEWLADKLLPPATDLPTTPSLETLLSAGTKLIGLLIIVQGIPSLVQSLFPLRHIMSSLGSHRWSPLSAQLLRIAIGAFLVIKTRPVVSFIIGKDGQNKALDATSQ